MYPSYADGDPIRPIAAPGVHETAVALFPSPPCRVLDIGAGPGAFSARLLKLGYDVRACDLNPEVFRVPAIVCDHADLGATLPYRDGAFDAVALIEVVEHLEHPLHAVQEAMRVTRSGGVVIMSTPNIQSFLARCHFFLRGNFGRWYPDRDIRGEDPRPGEAHIMPLHPQAVRRLIERSGGVLEEIRANQLLAIRQMNSALSLLGKIVETVVMPFMQPPEELLLRGDILVYRVKKPQ